MSTKSIVHLQYRHVGKYYEFVMDGEVKERASEFSVLLQKVKKYKLDWTNEKLPS